MISIINKTEPPLVIYPGKFQLISIPMTPFPHKFVKNKNWSNTYLINLKSRGPLPGPARKVRKRLPKITSCKKVHPINDSFHYKPLNVNENKDNNILLYLEFYFCKNIFNLFFHCSSSLFIIWSISKHHSCPYTLNVVLFLLHPGHI